MSEDAQKQPNKFLGGLWTTLLAPLIVALVLSALAGKIIISITGFQISIGMTILVILCIFLIMFISFYLGMYYFVVLIVSGLSNLLFKTAVPPKEHLLLRIGSFMLFPLYLYSRLQEKNATIQTKGFDSEKDEVTLKLAQPIFQKGNTSKNPDQASTIN